MSAMHASPEIVEAVRTLAEEDYGTIGMLPSDMQVLVDLINTIPDVEPITNPYD